MTKVPQSKDTKPQLSVVGKEATSSVIQLKLGDADLYAKKLNALPKLPFKVTYAIMRITEELQREAKRCDEASTEVYKELGNLVKGPDGIQRHVVPDGEKKEELVKRIVEIRDTDIELVRRPISFKLLLECKEEIEPSKLDGLGIFFNDKE